MTQLRTLKRMAKTTQRERIAKLIAGEIGDILTPDEERVLHSWVNERIENKALYQKIRSSDNFQNWRTSYEQLDAGSGWEELYPQIRKQEKKQIWLRVFKYAAILLLPTLLLVGVVNYLAKQNSNEKQLAQEMTEISPGTKKAFLTLDNGETVILDSGEEVQLKELDGTTIQKTRGQLTYLPSQAKTRTPLYNIVRTPRGGEYNLVLEDGTKVFLNAMSQIKYPVKFDTESREIELTGEAYFEVAQSAIPFVVKTSQLDVRVLGTTFNISAYENTGEIVTTLVEGKVEVDARQEGVSSLILQPEEQAVFNTEDQRLDVRKIDINLYTGWKDGQFIFYDMRLEDIMNSLTRWYIAEVSYSDSTVRNMRFSGSLKRNEDFSQILDIIKSTNRVDIEMYNNTVVFFTVQQSELN